MEKLKKTVFFSKPSKHYYCLYGYMGTVSGVIYKTLPRFQVYDKDLEKVAMAWAAQCVKGHDAFRDIGKPSTRKDSVCLCFTTTPSDH